MAPHNKMMTESFDFHPGMLEVQRRSGVAEEAEQIKELGYIGSVVVGSGFAMLQSEPRELFVSSVDPQGRVWASALFGNPGFVQLQKLQNGKDTITISPDIGSKLSWEGDGFLEGITAPGAAVGGLFMNHRNAKRYRIDGRRSASDPSVLSLHVNMAMGNCPKYVQRKELERVVQRPAHIDVEISNTITSAHKKQIESADFFVLGTAALAADGKVGADVSNRGGNPGFVTVVNATTLRWEDYPGNNLFLSLGNIVSYPFAGLLFPDRITGDMLQVTGRATIEWNETVVPAKRHIRIDVTEARFAKSASPLRFKHLAYSEFNPPLPQRSSETVATQQFLKLAEVVEAADGVKHFRFTAVGNASLAYVPGQFGTFEFPLSAFGRGEGTITRSWTITSLPESNYLEITVKRAAAASSANGGISVSQWLHSGGLATGAQVGFKGVGGDFTVASSFGELTPSSKLLFLSGGIGITPMVASLRTLVSEGISADAIFLHTTRDLKEVPFLEEIGHMAAHNKVKVAISTTVSNSASDAPLPPSIARLEGRLDIASLVKQVPDIAERGVMLCGPLGFMDAAQKMLEAAGVSPTKIFTESFSF